MTFGSAITFAFGLAAGAAMACDPQTRDAGQTLTGEACAVRHLHVPQGEEGLSAVENIWLGYVIQVYHESDGCTRREAQVVVDCAGGAVFSFAPAGNPAMTDADYAEALSGPYGTMAGLIRELSRDRASVEAWDQAAGLQVVDLGTVKEGPVGLGTRGTLYDLTCGCRHLRIGPVGGQE